MNQELRNFDARPAGRLLASAFRSGARLDGLPDDMRPSDMREGYDVQDAFVDASGDRVVGWKVGLNSRSGMRGAGLDNPVFGRVLAGACYARGDVVRLPNPGTVAVECEIGFVIKRDIAPGETIATMMDAVERTIITFEIVQSRFAQPRGVGWPAFVGDNSAFRALVVGDTIGASVDHISRDVVVLMDGIDVARGVSGDDYTNPWGSLSALLSHTSARGMTLPQGAIVSTGAVAKPFDITAASCSITGRVGDHETTFRLQT